MYKGRLALELEHYIRDYIPKGWKESIENVMFVPWVSVIDLNMILNHDIPDKFNRFPFTEAILSWKEKTFNDRVVVDEEGVFIDGKFEPWSK